jgi:hypothetical protein
MRDVAQNVFVFGTRVSRTRTKMVFVFDVRRDVRSKTTQACARHCICYLASFSVYGPFMVTLSFLQLHIRK